MLFLQVVNQTLKYQLHFSTNGLYIQMGCALFLLPSLLHPLSLWLVRKCSPEMLSDVPPCRHPNIWLVGNVFHKVAECFASTRFTDNTRVQRNVHHPATFAVQHIEGVLEIVLVTLAHTGAKSRGHMEFAIITVVLAQSVSTAGPPTGQLPFNRMSELTL